MTINACRQQGFTLIEILAVLVILGVLAAVAVPKYHNLQEEAEKKAALASVAEAQGRLHQRFGQLLLQGETCEKATAQVNKLSFVEDSSGEGRFGDYILTVSGGTISINGNAVSAKRYDATAAATDTGTKLYLPLCDDGSGTEEDGNKYYGMGLGKNGVQYPKFDFRHALVDALTAVKHASMKYSALGNISMDSSVPEGKSNYMNQVLAMFTKGNIDPSLSNIGSWSYTPYTNNSTTQKNNGTMIWSETNIANSTPGSQVLAMSYDVTTGKYAVGNVTVNKKNVSASGGKEPYSLNSFFDYTKNQSTWDKATQSFSSFDEALKYYNTLKK